MKPPAFQFYADDFIAGTFTFSNEQCGLYIRLLALQWNQGGLVEGTFNALSTGMTPAKVAEVRSKFVKGEDGLFRNQRLEAEREKQAEFRKKCSEAGRRSVEGRLKVPSRSVEGAFNSPSPSPSPISNLQSPSPSPKDVVNGNTTVEGVRGRGIADKRFKVPTLDEVKAMFSERNGPESEAERFWNYYSSNGWRVGRNAMKSLPHAASNWIRNYLDRGGKLVNNDGTLKGYDSW